MTSAIDCWPTSLSSRTGSTLSHVAFDRAVFAGMAKSVVAWLKAMATPEFCEQDASVRLYGDRLEWFVATACCYHDFHGGYKNGMRPFTTTEILSHLYIVLESIRNSFLMIHKMVPLFICQNIRYSSDPLDYDEVYHFWARMGIPSDMLETVVQANPFWDGVKLNTVVA